MQRRDEHPPVPDAPAPAQPALTQVPGAPAVLYCEDERTSGADDDDDFDLRPTD
jgi:hypothetical protein